MTLDPSNARDLIVAALRRKKYAGRPNAQCPGGPVDIGFDMGDPDTCRTCGAYLIFMSKTRDDHPAPYTYSVGHHPKYWGREDAADSATLADAIEAGEIVITKPMDAHGAVAEIYQWLGFNRDGLEPDAVHRLQDIAAGILAETNLLREVAEAAKGAEDALRAVVHESGGEYYACKLALPIVEKALANLEAAGVKL